MNDQAFKKNWDDITFNRPAQFTKLDTILDNPAPAHVPATQVLTQVANFLKATLNMTIVASPTDGRTIVRAAG
jgi:hypothetical protein